VTYARLLLPCLDSIASHFMLNFMVVTVSLGHVSRQELRIFLSVTFHQLIHPQRCIILAGGSFVMQLTPPPDVSLIPSGDLNFRLHEQVNFR
jgi:hypothetical protein